MDKWGVEENHLTISISFKEVKITKMSPFHKNSEQKEAFLIIYSDFYHLLIISSADCYCMLIVIVCLPTDCYIFLLNEFKVIYNKSKSSKSKFYQF